MPGYADRMSYGFIYYKNASCSNVYTYNYIVHIITFKIGVYSDKVLLHKYAMYMRFSIESLYKKNASASD